MPKLPIKRPSWPIEAVLILTELRSPFARRELVRLAGDQQNQDGELRQAAVWGLGKASYGLIGRAAHQSASVIEGIGLKSFLSHRRIYRSHLVQERLLLASSPIPLQ